LTVPSLATFEIVCDHVDTLAPIGEFFGPRRRPTAARIVPDWDGPKLLGV
jgi:hypothetical protein